MKVRLLRRLPLAAFLFLSIVGFAQSSYRYSVDLTKVVNDRLTVELIAPPISKATIKFYLPRIVPGTYMNSNFGKYVHDLKALDKAGKALPVKKLNDNSWEIGNAQKINRVVYQVEDTWDSEIDNKVYPMVGTNIEDQKNFVINTCGFFGYFEGMKNTAFELSFTKPANFYGATGLKPVMTSATKDLFRCDNADHLYDSPIMFSLPDTTTMKVGNADVLIAVYAPKKEATSAFIAKNFEKLMLGSKDYLGGKLPVDKYAFLFYFNSEQKKFVDGGAWEHSYSSFYSLEEEPQETAIAEWIDIAAHEFFHIVSPLTISSKEVKQFDFNETHLSKHLWLYEGSTEYYSHHMQVWTGMKTPDEFLSTLAGQIRYSRLALMDSLPFTELSTESAGKWKDQYINVYLKGSVISACIDLYLFKLSDGQYGIRDLKHDLGIQYGKDKFFNDADLFDIVANLTYPEMKEFLLKYVQGPTPIPYETFFAYAGVDYLPKQTIKEITFGKIDITNDSTGKLTLGVKNMNEFGKKMGYLEGDELISLNGEKLSEANMGKVLAEFPKKTMEGDPVTVVVRRKDANGQLKEVVLTSAAMKVDKVLTHVLRWTDSPTAAQLKIRKAWLNGHDPKPKQVTARPADVSEIDPIINALYAVISGPAGPRDWDRFRSLFHPDAYMAASTQKGELRKFTPEEYIGMNGPFFEKNSFQEKELGRTVNRFGNIAQVFTSYAFEAGTTPPMNQRGINSVELIFDAGRWWIMSVSWNDELKDRPIPDVYLKK